MRLQQIATSAFLLSLAFSIGASAGSCRDLLGDAVGTSPTRIASDIDAALERGISPYKSRALYENFEGRTHALETLLRRWYGHEVEPMLEFFTRNMAVETRALLLDPAVVARFGELRPRLLLLKDSRTAYELRSRMEQDLGKIRIYRGVVLTREQAAAIEQHGLRARGLSDEKTFAAILRATYAVDAPAEPLRHASSPLGELQLRHDQEHLVNSTWMSVSLHSSVAASAGYWHSGMLKSLPRRGEPLLRERSGFLRFLPGFGGGNHGRRPTRLGDRALYVFTFDVSPLDVIPMSGPFRRHQMAYRLYSTYQGMSGTERGPKLPLEEVELFVPYLLRDPVSIERIDVEPDFIRSESSRNHPDGLNMAPTHLEKTERAPESF